MFMEFATHGSQHFHDVDETLDHVLHRAGHTHDAVGRHWTTRGVHFDFHAKVLAHVSQLATSFADDTARLALMYQHPQLRIFTTAVFATAVFVTATTVFRMSLLHQQHITL